MGTFEVVNTIIMTVATIGIFYANKKSAEATKKSAEAAEASARAAQLSGDIAKLIYEEKEKRDSMIKQQLRRIVLMNAKKVLAILTPQTTQTHISSEAIRYLPENCGVEAIQQGEYLDSNDLDMIDKAWDSLDKYIDSHFRDSAKNIMSKSVLKEQVEKDAQETIRLFQELIKRLS
jgi:hypothetical protein